MNAKERKALQSYVNGEDLDSHSLRLLVSRLMTIEKELREELQEEKKESEKGVAEAERIKGLLLEQLGEIAELKMEKLWLVEQLKVKSIGYREQRLINLAKSIISELDIE